MRTTLLSLALLPMLLAALPAAALTRYVDVNSTNATPPYTNWSTAANVIQDAVDAAVAGDTVLVTNGVYDTGGKAVYGLMTNRVAVDKPLTLVSVNGPEFTVIEGYQVPVTTNGDKAIRCAYLTNGALLSGFTLTIGATRLSGEPDREASGGGLWCDSPNARASNCVVAGNSSGYGAGGVFGGSLQLCMIASNRVSDGRAWGGGVWNSVLDGCVIVGNAAYIGGGSFEGEAINSIFFGNTASLAAGAADTVLKNCTVVFNTATAAGGGVGYGYIYRVMDNCIIYHNSAPSAPNVRHGLLNNCSTIPLPLNGTGNITNAPLFVDTNGWVDLRLQSNSPCINAGNNAYVTTTNDRDGNPRIVGDTVDVGAYEFQFPQSSISYAYLQQYGLPTDGSADYSDSDSDFHNTWQEWKAWTDPTNELSVLRMLNPQPGTNETAVSWQSVSGHSYLLERATNLGASFSLLQSNIVDQAGTTAFTDTTATNGDTFLYRVAVPQ